jgi:NAD-reducing hydrogenase small subunit
MDRIKVATVWLSGCAGCHMSFLDLDEFLIDVSDKIEVVFSPIADIKEFPKNVDIVLVEGAVGYDEQIHLAKTIRERSKIVIAFGDCAMTGNVPAMRNPLGKPEIVKKRAYIELANENPQMPNKDEVLPVLLDRVRPLHEVIKVDYYLPGCPPPADRIKLVLGKLLAGEKPVLEGNDLKNG